MKSQLTSFYAVIPLADSAIKRRVEDNPPAPVVVDALFEIDNATPILAVDNVTALTEGY